MQEKDILLSIIIPVYNVRDYLNKCIQSILSQSVDGCEILLIDDGSTDGSGELCDELAKTSDKIMVYHKVNGGLSDARNYGIKRANGEYLMFIDSDDYINNGSIVYFKDKIQKYNCDVYVAKSYVVDENGNIFDEVKYSIKEGKYSFEEYMKTLKKHKKSAIFCAPYYICKKSIIDTNNLSFLPGIIHEDELWTAELLLKTASIYYCDYYFYFHLVRNNSIMHSNNNEKSGLCLLKIGKILIDKFDEDKRKLDFMRNRVADFYLQAYPKLGYKQLKLFDRKLPLKNSYYFSTKMKAVLFLLFPRLYLRIWNKKYKI